MAMAIIENYRKPYTPVVAVKHRPSKHAKGKQKRVVTKRKSK